MEEQLQLATEKINNAQQAGAYGSGTANSQSKEWKSFEDPSIGINFLYPPDSSQYNTTGFVNIMLNVFDGKSLGLLYLDLANISLINEKLGGNIPLNEVVDKETLTAFANFSINSAFNTTGALLIEDITSDKWKVNGENATSYILSTNTHSFSEYIRTEAVLFTNPDKNMLFVASFTHPSSEFEILEVQALEKKFIDSIKFSK